MLVTFYLFIENSLDCVCEIVIPPPPPPPATNTE